MKVVDPGGQLFDRSCVRCRVRDLFLLGLAACGPRWLDAHEQPIALHDVVAAAAADHDCNHVVPRCDASHGSTWEFELDVCGQIRRYTVTDQTYGEVPVSCDEAICLGPQPACRSQMRGGWWAIEAHAPERCDDAPVDDNLHVGFDGGFVRVTADGHRAVHASCDDPSFLVSVDGQWFALCGSRPPADVDGIAIEPGLMTGTGDHDVYAAYLSPSGCVRSREEAVHNIRPLTWVDLVVR
jgi:hypothetical protein